MKEAVMAMTSDYAMSYMHCPIRSGACAGAGCMMWHKMIDEEAYVTLDIGMCGFNNYQLSSVVVLNKVVDESNETE